MGFAENGPVAWDLLRLPGRRSRGIGPTARLGVCVRTVIPIEFDVRRPSLAMTRMSSVRKREGLVLCRSLPASSQCTVELDQGEGLALLRGGQVQLRRKEVGVVGEDFKVGCRSTFIAEAG